MAITKIHSIQSTPQKAISYILKDKEVLEKNNKHISEVINYYNNTLNSKVYRTLNTFQNCTEKNVIKDFISCMQQGRGKLKKETPRTKTGKEILMWHLVQSFDEKIDPILVNEIGRKLAKEIFSNFPVVISTHTNTNNIHNHFMICAWDLDGRKWNDCHKTKRLIRQVSDRLCEEYNLNVLYNTKDMKLVKYKDKDGKNHYYEPTNRKIDNIKKQKTLKEIVKNDIDSILPVVKDYQDLVDTLKQMGYIIKDKKTNKEEWLKYITFIPFGRERGIRDCQLGEFYSRESLIEYFKTKNSLQHEDEEESKSFNFQDYEYKNLDIFGSRSIVLKNNIEKRIIQDIRQNEKELYNLFDLSVLKEKIETYKKKKQNIKYIAQYKEEIIIQQIQDSFNAICFLQEKELYNIEQIKQMENIIAKKYNECLESKDKLNTMLEELKNVLKIPEKLESIKQNIKNTEYNNVELELEQNLLNMYEEIIKKYKLDNFLSKQKLTEKVLKIESRLQGLNNSLIKFEIELESYRNSIKILDKVCDQRLKVKEKKKYNDRF